MAHNKTDAAVEVQRLQQELARLRQKDIRQEHHIRTLTEQLEQRQLISSQVADSVPGPDSSVTAKWQEWHQNRSLSPDPFKRHRVFPGRHGRGTAQPVGQAHISPDMSTAACTARGASPPHAAEPHLLGAATSPDLLQQPSVQWSSKSCSFGSERRWYQPGQAADRAAALQHEALAAAAAERQVDDASWLLTHAPRSRSVSNQRSTFGSELRFWEDKSNEIGQTYHKDQDAPSRQASPVQQRQQSPTSMRHHHIPARVKQKASCASKKRYTFGLAPRWYEYDNGGSAQLAGATRQKPAHNFAQPEPSQRTAAADRATASYKSKAHSRARSVASLHTSNSRRSVSVVPSTGRSRTPESDRKWWLSDSAAVSDAVLRRIQDKHAQIQQLAALISQQKSSPGDFQYDKPTYKTGKASSRLPHVLQGQVTSSAAQHTQQVPVAEANTQGMPSTHIASAVQPVRASDLLQSADSLPTAQAASAASASSVLPTAQINDPRDFAAQLGSSTDMQQQPSPSRVSQEQRGHISRLGSSSLAATADADRIPSHVASHQTLPPPQTNLITSSSDGIFRYNSQTAADPLSATWPRKAQYALESPGEDTASGRSQPLNRSLSASPTLRRTASICDRSGLQEDLRHRSAERTRLDQMVAPHPRNWVANLRESCHWERSNSIKKTREMQEDFVQQAESQLELFKQTSQSFSDTASQAALNATQTSSQGPALPLKQPPQKAPAPTTRHLRQILRTGSKSARQASGSGESQAQRQGKGKGASSSSSKRMAMLQQQQEQAAQAAEEKLAAFQAARPGRPSASKALGSQGGQSARSEVRGRPQGNTLSSRQVASKTSKHMPKPPGVLSTLDAQQQQHVRRASSGISWAAELQLQEPEDEDVGQHHHSGPVPVYTAVGTSPAVAALELQPGQQWQAGAAEGMFAVGVQTSEMQRERLNAYYRRKAAAEHAAYLDAKLYAEQVEQQTAQQQRQQSERGEAFSMPAEPSTAPGSSAANADSVLQRLREVKAMASSLSLPSYGSANLPQSELEGLSPGLPGLQSQLSKMMQEVSQARNEVLGLRSELDHSSLVSHKSGNFGVPRPDAAW